MISKIKKSKKLYQKKRLKGKEKTGCSSRGEAIKTLKVKKNKRAEVIKEKKGKEKGRQNEMPLKTINEVLRLKKGKGIVEEERRKRGKYPFGEC